MGIPSKTRKKKQPAKLDKAESPSKPQQGPMSLEELGAAILARTKELESDLKPSRQFAGELK